MNGPFYIDKITACIEEVKTGKTFQTEVLPVEKSDLKNIVRRNGWNFSWRSFLQFPERKLYKLVIKGDADCVVQGLISFEIREDFIEMHHVENAPHNYGSKKQFAGVCANLVAFVCKLSFDLKFDGFVAFTAKTLLIDHYTETLGAKLIFPPQRMAIFPDSARILVNSYYKNYFNAQ